jgi:MoxR-like ATPase
MNTSLKISRDFTKAPTKRFASAPVAPEPYVASAALVDAVNLAIFLRRPLLLEGEAGCGKTRLAQAVAYQLGLPFFKWNVRSTSKVAEGLYTYDALLRLHDVQTAKAKLPGNSQRQPADATCYRTFGALGKAFQQTKCPAIVLIDEIDKADIDFPNDLLTVLEKPWSFDVIETGEPTIKANEANLPIVFITSNKEKGNLPAPFLRRCLYHYVEFPNETALREIVASHFPELTDPARADTVTAALARFDTLRERADLYKRPGTSELLDWIHALLGFRGDAPYPAAELANVEKPLPFLEVLFKVRPDWQLFRAPMPSATGSP